jgi:hypothetical protein
MQLYAFNQQKEKVFVEHAEKQADFYCMECGSIMRRRGGLYKQPHFYHLQAPSHCRQEGKSLEHLAIQQHILKSLGESCRMEAAFPEIDRIADLAWHEKNLIFEVQCSKISVEEVRARSQDYSSIGWNVIWILYDATFHQRKASPVERFLSSQTHYFASIRGDNEVFIYDSFDPIDDRGIRIRKKAPLFSIDLASIVEREQKTSDIPNLSPYMAARCATWHFSAMGDSIDLLQNCAKDSQDGRNKYVHLFIESNTKKLKLYNRLYYIINNLFSKLYKILLQKTCLKD